MYRPDEEPKFSNHSAESVRLVKQKLLDYYHDLTKNPTQFSQEVIFKELKCHYKKIDQAIFQRDPSIEEIDRLLEFLPVFSDENYDPVQSIEPVPCQEPKIVYKPEIEEFFKIVRLYSCWRSHDYIPGEAEEKLKKAKHLEDSEIDEVKKLLTYCVRSGNKSDHWAIVIQRGYLKNILNRLNEIRKEL